MVVESEKSEEGRNISDRNVNFENSMQEESKP